MSELKRYTARMAKRPKNKASDYYKCSDVDHEIAKLKNERDLWIDRAEQLWSMYERDAPTPNNSVTWFDDMGAAKREAAK